VQKAFKGDAPVDLPSDAMGLIFKYSLDFLMLFLHDLVASLVLIRLFAPSEIAKFALVCRAWAREAKDPSLWFSLFCKYFPNNVDLEKALYSIRSLGDVRI